MMYDNEYLLNNNIYGYHSWNPSSEYVIWYGGGSTYSTID